MAQHLDCAPLEQACAAYHHARAAGAQATHTVPRLVRALLVKYLWHLSLRELAYTIRTNLVVRWFVGYGLFERTPDHSTLERFEQWVIEQHGRTFFDETLKQIDQEFPEERRHAQVGDTLRLRSGQALRDAGQRRQRGPGAPHPPHLPMPAARPDGRRSCRGRGRHCPTRRPRLFGAAGAAAERAEFYLDAEARRVRLQTTVVAALACADLVQSQLAAAALPSFAPTAVQVHR